MFGLSKNTIDKINSIFDTIQEIDKVVIYGSRAKGNFTEDSDIDLSLKGNQLTDQIVSIIKSKLEELNLPYLFDISIYNTLISKELKEHIDRKGKLFYNTYTDLKN